MIRRPRKHAFRRRPQRSRGGYPRRYVAVTRLLEIVFKGSR